MYKRLAAGIVILFFVMQGALSFASTNLRPESAKQAPGVVGDIQGDIIAGQGYDGYGPRGSSWQKKVDAMYKTETIPGLEDIALHDDVESAHIAIVALLKNMSLGGESAYLISDVLIKISAQREPLTRYMLDELEEVLLTENLMFPAYDAAAYTIARIFNVKPKYLTPLSVRTLQSVYEQKLLPSASRSKGKELVGTVLYNLLATDIIAEQEGQETTGRRVTLSGANVLVDYYFSISQAGRTVTYRVDENGDIKAGDLKIPVYEVKKKWFLDNAIIGNGITLRHDGRAIIVVAKDVGDEQKQKALAHEFVAALALSGGTQETRESKTVHDMAGDFELIAAQGYDDADGNAQMEKNMSFNFGAVGQKERFDAIVSKLRRADFESHVDDLYGLPRQEAQQKDPYFAKIGFDGNENRLGWSMENLRWVLAHPEIIQSVLEDAKLIRGNYKYVIFCGMGGSGLSVQTVKTTFGEKDTKIFSLRTTDPAAIKEILDEIAAYSGDLRAALKDTLIIPISKSGKTEETRTHLQYFQDLLPRMGLDAKSHMWVITDKGSPMDSKLYPQREIQLNEKGDIGGRFTAPTTRVFLLPLAIVAPERVKIMLEIAQKMNEASGIEKDAFLTLAAYIFYNAAELKKDKLTMLVPKELRDIPVWFEQLLEESLGKDNKGITLFYGEDLDMTALKAVAENDRIFLRINLGKKKTEAKLWNSLVSKGYPVFEIDIDSIDGIGGVMLGLERAVAAVGYLWDICFVNQPAVEGYKKATREVMAQIAPGEKVVVPAQWKSAEYKSLRLYYSPLIDAGVVTEAELMQKLMAMDADASNAAAVYAAVIELLQEKGRLGAAEMAVYARKSGSTHIVLETAREVIFTRLLKLPSKLGEGPDKNHSYHQNVEDGGIKFFSTYFMPGTYDQPEAMPYDDNLIKAQTIGTVNSLVKNKRPVVLIASNQKLEASDFDLKEFFSYVDKYLNRPDRGYMEALDRAMKGDKKAYAELKKIALKSPGELIRFFESQIDSASQTVSEDMFGKGFGYDVRGNALPIKGGIVDLTPINVYMVGKALASKFAEQGEKVLFTGDQRVHTPILRLAMALGALSCGVDVEFSDEVLGTGEHVILSRENEGGHKIIVQVSGSHGVPEKNGFKIKFKNKEGLIMPLYANDLVTLYQAIKAKDFRKPAVRNDIKEIKGLVAKAVDYYDRTLAKTDPQQPLIIDCRNSAITPALKALVERREFKDVTWINDVPDGRMPGGIWDPSKSEALATCQQAVMEKNRVLAQQGSKYRALGWVPDGDGDRMVSILEDGRDVLSFEMVLPFYQRFLSDPVNQQVVKRLKSEGFDDLCLMADIRSNSTLLRMMKNYPDFKLYYIQPGYPPQWEFIMWQVKQINKFIDANPSLRHDEQFMKDLRHFINTYFTAEASGHQFFHLCPYHPEYIADAGIGVMFSALYIKDTIASIEANDPNVKLPKKNAYELRELFDSFPQAQSSEEVRVAVPNLIKGDLEQAMVAKLQEYYRDQLKPAGKGVFKVGGMRLQDVNEGAIITEGIKVQLKTGGTSLNRKSNTGEQATLMFEGSTDGELIKLMYDMKGLIASALEEMAVDADEPIKQAIAKVDTSDLTAKTAKEVARFMLTDGFKKKIDAEALMAIYSPKVSGNNTLLGLIARVADAMAQGKKDAQIVLAYETPEQKANIDRLLKGLSAEAMAHVQAEQIGAVESLVNNKVREGYAVMYYKTDSEAPLPGAVNIGIIDVPAGLVTAEFEKQFKEAVKALLEV